MDMTIMHRAGYTEHMTAYGAQSISQRCVKSFKATLMDVRPANYPNPRGLGGTKKPSVLDVKLDIAKSLRALVGLLKELVGGDAGVSRPRLPYVLTACSILTYLGRVFER